MKVVILAGGHGTRFAEETELRPKPMIEIGGKPILWHIMKIYSHFGFNEFVLCLGYKGQVIKEYFKNYFLYASDVTLDIKNNSMEVHENSSEPWKITLVDTGLDTQTGGRVKRIEKYIGNQPFMLTYGDGVGNVEIPKLIEFHEKSKRENKTLCTVTATQPPGRFGSLEISTSGRVDTFYEKPHGDGAWINGGFFVVEPEVFKLIPSDQTTWELGPLFQLSKEKKLAAYRHSGFWLPMDTLRDRKQLEDLWQKGQAPWNVWSEKI